MKDFFTFYTNISSITFPFVAFHFAHLIFVLCGVLAIVFIMRKYNTLSKEKQGKLKAKIAMFFIVEEVVYTIWAFSVTSGDAWQYVLPFELCSMCAYANGLTLVCKNDYLRFFSGFVGLIAGSIAVAYPANISGLYPALSYRTINFFLLHLSFILFSCMQFKDVRLLQYKYLKKNIVVLSCIIIVVFVINLMLQTQYMFVGLPPTNAIVNALYRVSGDVFFLPAACIIVALIQVVVLYCLRRIYKVKQHEVVVKEVVYE